MQLIQGEKQVRFLTEDQMAVVEGIVEQLERKPDIKHMMQTGQAEKSLFWRDPEIRHTVQDTAGHAGAA